MNIDAFLTVIVTIVQMPPCSTSSSSFSCISMADSDPILYILD